LFLETLEKRKHKHFVVLKIIKLDATLSTNDMAKELLALGQKKEDTAIWAVDQTAGRGQQGTGWYAKPGESLTFSLIKYFDKLPAEKATGLNMAVSLGIYKALESYQLPDLAIKWPNDILSAGRKLAGILIENQLRSAFIDSAIIGVGLNVNNDQFPQLPKATSMKLASGRSFEIEPLYKEVCRHILELLRTTLDFETLKAGYESVLFMHNKTSFFEDRTGQRFEGRITGVSRAGKLCIALDSGDIREFGVKEVELLY